MAGAAVGMPNALLAEVDAFETDADAAEEAAEILDEAEDLAEARSEEAAETADATLLVADATAPLMMLLLVDMPAWFMDDVVCAAAKEAIARTMMFLNCIFAGLVVEN